MISTGTIVRCCQRSRILDSGVPIDQQKPSENNCQVNRTHRNKKRGGAKRIIAFIEYRKRKYLLIGTKYQITCDKKTSLIKYFLFKNEHLWLISCRNISTFITAAWIFRFVNIGRISSNFSELLSVIRFSNIYIEKTNDFILNSFEFYIRPKQAANIV